MKVENKYIEPFQEVFILKYPDALEHETKIPVGAILRITRILISETLYTDYMKLHDSHIYVYIDGQKNFDLIGLAVNTTNMGTCDLVIPVKRSYKFEFVPSEDIGGDEQYWTVVHVEGYIEAK